MLSNINFSGICFMMIGLICLFSCRQIDSKHPGKDVLYVDIDTADRFSSQDYGAKAKVLEKNGQVPDYVIEILTYIRINNKAPANYLGGRRFYNREKRLPGLNEQNEMIYYQEWDVHKKETGKNRGPERLITSVDKAYYTKDHYTTFILIKEIY